MAMFPARRSSARPRRRSYLGSSMPGRRRRRRSRGGETGPVARVTYLSVFVRRCDDHSLVEVEGDIDIASAPWLQHRLLTLPRAGLSPLLVDLSGVPFIDCFGTRLLAETRRLAEQQARPIHFVALSQPVRRLAELIGLAGELPVSGPDAGRNHPHRGDGVLRLPAVR